MNDYEISITWGKSCNYIPHCVEKICWDGSLTLKDGAVKCADLVHIDLIQWCQAKESPERIYDHSRETQGRNTETCISWRSAVLPGSSYTLEGLRLRISGDDQTVVAIDFAHTRIQFKLRELLQKEQLRYHAGGKYSGFPIDVFLGPDARPRLSRKQYLQSLRIADRAGYLLVPNDFTDAGKTYYHSMYGAEIRPRETIRARFPIENYGAKREGYCNTRIQLTSILGYKDAFAEEKTTFIIQIGSWNQTISYIFTNRLFLPKLEELYIQVPWTVLHERENEVSVTYVEGEHSLLLHRIAFGAVSKNMLPRTAFLPKLPEDPGFYVGTETDLLTPANGDVDALIERLKREELGNYVMFRERAAWSSDEDIIRWAKKIKDYRFLAATSGATPENEQMFDRLLGSRYLGEQAHEISNLAYGWGDADPIEVRKNRTLKECKENYLQRMGAHRIVGQALPQQCLDYEAGVNLVMTETPASHATLTLDAARGSSFIYDKPFWGVHIANHVTRAPLDQEHVRRLFILLHQCWLHGASILQDEEVAYRYNHDTIYSYSEKLPEAYREQYQDIYHYANRVVLGQPVVPTGFLQGNYDLLIGGLQAHHTTPRTKVWGAFGPESECWEFDTPESGWKLIDFYLPGVWLYPVLQDRSKIRLFFAGSPNGQVDLIPVTAPVEKLLRYPVLILPGWNTMTQEIYRNLCEYADRGGHLILCAAQCTEHVTREFLKEKDDFAFINNGDLSALAGVRVSKSDGIISMVCFDDETVSVQPSIKALETTVCGADVLATDGAGNPVIVEKQHDKGRVWMLCAGDYWGAEALDDLRLSLCRRIVRENRQSVWLTGDTQDVDYYVFSQNEGERIVLLNTDWTSSQNKKYVTVNTPDLRMETSVTEGRTKHILVRDHFALSFEIPSAIVDDAAINDGKLFFILGGAGSVQVEIFTDSQICIGEAHNGAWNKMTLRMEMGETWSERKMEIPIRTVASK